MQRALAAQIDSRFDEAETLYIAALTQQPDQADCLHMLGVIDYVRNNDLAALNRIERANVLTDWRVAMMRSNLALVVGRMLGCAPDSEATVEQRAQVAATRRTSAHRRAQQTPPLVSVIVPSFNHASYIEVALASVFAQTYRHLELIVIDDGSTDDSPAILERVMVACPFPHRLLLRGNRGAATTINEGIALAQGAYVNVLNSDDAFEPARIALCVQYIHDAGADWGFSRCTVIDAHGEPVPDSAPVAHSVTASTNSLRRQPCVSDAFFRANPAISTGNLFVSKTLMSDVGGFSDLRYNHDWQFCLSASWRSEPVYLEMPLYRYRLHGRNTILESTAAARAEADALIVHALRRAEASRSNNPLALSMDAEGPRFWSAALAHATLFEISADALKRCVAAARALPARDAVLPT